MKWNAIITRAQYEKALQREKEIAGSLPGPQEQDELWLLRTLIRDYEKRQPGIQVPGFQLTPKLP
jgi:hypothetical protein